MIINQIILVGRVGGDPDVRRFESGSVKARFSLAVDRLGSQKGDDPDWHNIECWGKTAEIVEQYVHKGTQLSVEGSLKRESYTTREGHETFSFFIKADQIKLLGSKSDNAAQSTPTEYDEF